MTLELFLSKNDFPNGSLTVFRNVLLKENGASLPLFELQDEEEAGEFFGTSVTAVIEERLGLIFETGSRNNVCLANNSEVRPEFRTSFTANELLEYIFAVISYPGISSAGTVEKIILSYPADSESFWEKVEQGKKKKQQFK